MIYVYTHETITNSYNKTFHHLQKSPCAPLWSIHSSTFTPRQWCVCFSSSQRLIFICSNIIWSHIVHTLFCLNFSLRILSLSLSLPPLSPPFSESSMFLNVTILHSFYCWIILIVQINPILFIYLIMDTWIVFRFWLLQKKLIWTYVY